MSVCIIIIYKIFYLKYLTQVLLLLANERISNEIWKNVNIPARSGGIWWRRWKLIDTENSRQAWEKLMCAVKNWFGEQGRTNRSGNELIRTRRVNIDEEHNRVYAECFDISDVRSSKGSKTWIYAAKGMKKRKCGRVLLSDGLLYCFLCAAWCCERNFAIIRIISLRFVILIWVLRRDCFV